MLQKDASACISNIWVTRVIAMTVDNGDNRDDDNDGDTDNDDGDDDDGDNEEDEQ